VGGDQFGGDLRFVGLHKMVLSRGPRLSSPGGLVRCPKLFIESSHRAEKAF
jgi:hypothetical protein